MKKLITFITISAIIGVSVGVYADWREEMSWAVEGVEYCMSRGILEGDHTGDLMLDRNLTRSQAAKMLTEAFGLTDNASNSFTDTDSTQWDYTYINAVEAYVPKKTDTFRGSDNITREEFGALTAAVIGFTPDYDNSLHTVFSDASKIDYDYRGYIKKAVDAGIIKGSDGNFRPKAKLTRAEACTMVMRAVNDYNERTGGISDIPSEEVTATPEPEVNQDSTQDTSSVVQPFTTSTDILGAPQISVEQAQAWARSKGATEKYINIAPSYWYYGQLTGIRPEVLYAQAALETGYGKYTGVVSEDMNNWAGIKVKNRNDDAKDAHETFATPEDGARAHFNHMAAYVGVEPVGEPHGRYYSVKSMDWAGTVRTLEELSGKWCPDPNYANKILEGCLIPMSKF